MGRARRTSQHAAQHCRRSHRPTTVERTCNEQIDAATETQQDEAVERGDLSPAELPIWRLGRIRTRYRQICQEGRAPRAAGCTGNLIDLLPRAQSECVFCMYLSVFDTR